MVQFRCNGCGKHFSLSVAPGEHITEQDVMCPNMHCDLPHAKTGVVMEARYELSMENTAFSGGRK